jgi:hypothetical protein
LIQAFQTESSLKMSPIRALTTVAVSTQVCVVDLAIDHENGGHQGQQELTLRFAKWPAVASRPATRLLRLSIRAPWFTCTCTLGGG